MFSNFLVLTYRFRYFRKGKSEKGCVEIEDWGFSVHFVLSFRYFWEGTSEKGCVEIEDWGFSVPFVLGFEETPFTPYAYVFAKVLQNGAKFIQKLTPCFKNYMKDLKNFRKAAESLNLMCFVQKLHSFT